MRVILYNTEAEVSEASSLVYQEIIKDYPFVSSPGGNYQVNFPNNTTTNQWALKVKQYYEDQIIRALGLSKYEDQVEIFQNDPNWFPQRT
tara:strand:+ start:663 stop:932 length:270 start_codon:yes stop_codon:yes gene_type:complete